MTPDDFFSVAADLMRNGKPFVSATVIRTEGSTLARPGFRVLVSADGKLLHGTLGGACPESVISQVAQEVLDSGKPRIFKIHLEEAEKAVRGSISQRKRDEIFVETFCGGNMELFVEPFTVPDRIVVITPGGKDEISDYITSFAGPLGMRVEVLDLSRFSEAGKNNVQDPLESFLFSNHDHVVILTRGEEDIKVLRRLYREKVSYIGLLASRKRSSHDFLVLRKEGVAEDFINSIHTPVGLDIGAVLPSEIGLSILAEIISVKRIRANMAPAGTSKD